MKHSAWILTISACLASPVAAQQIDQFGVGTGCGPWGIAGGRDGKLWVTCGSSNEIVSVSQAGAVVGSFSLLHSNSYPVGIATGPDGNLWFGEHNGNRMAKITTAGIITEFDLPNSGSGVVGVAPGSDGNVWFTEQQGHRVGKITPSGGITEYTDPNNPSMTPGFLALGPDGNIWVSEGTNNVIAKVTPAGVFTDYTAPSAISIGGITNGADGYLWFVEDGADKVARIRASDGHIDEFGPFPGESGFGQISLGADGRIWVDENAHSKLLRLHSSGVLQAVFTTQSHAWNGIAGPDGNVWWINGAADAVTRADIATGFEDFPFLCLDGSGGGSVLALPDGSVWGAVSLLSTHSFARLVMPALAIQYLAPEYPGLALDGGGRCMAVDAAGNLWFPNAGDNAIEEFTGATTNVFPLLTPNALPECVVSGPDGNFWFTEGQAPKVGRVTPQGAVAEFSLPSGGASEGITAGPDGNLWFADPGAVSIGRVTTSGDVAQYPASVSHPHSIAADSALLWFTSESSQLGSMTIAGSGSSIELHWPTESVAADDRGAIWIAAGALVEYRPQTGGIRVRQLPFLLTNQISVSPVTGVWYGTAEQWCGSAPCCDGDHPGVFGHLRWEIFVDGFEAGNVWRWSTRSF